MSAMKKLTRRSFAALAGASLAAPLFAPRVLGQAAPRVVVIGGGPGGATVARYVAKDSNGAIDVTLVERLLSGLEVIVRRRNEHEHRIFDSDGRWRRGRVGRSGRLNVCRRGWRNGCRTAMNTGSAAGHEKGGGGETNRSNSREQPARLASARSSVHRALPA